MANTGKISQIIGPVGTKIASPVSVTSAPLTSPSVESIDIALTVF